MDDEGGVEIEPGESKVAIDARALRVLSDDDARTLFQEVLGAGSEWRSELMQYRTTSEWQDDWVVEVGNWLATARRLGFLESLLGRVRHIQRQPGRRSADDPVHRTLNQWLAHAETAYYFTGIGWSFEASEPNVGALRGDRAYADIDLQLRTPDGSCVVDTQIKASGTQGNHDAETDPHIRSGAMTALEQLPDPPLGPALVVICAQRGWWLSADIDVLEPLLGSTGTYPNGETLLHDNRRGVLHQATHVSGLVALDLRRGADGADYGCTVVANPWADYPLDPGWFPHSRALIYESDEFRWLRGKPLASTYPDGTRMAPSDELPPRQARSRRRLRP